MSHSYDGGFSFTDARTGSSYGPHRAPFSFTVTSPFVRKDIKLAVREDLEDNDSVKRYHMETESWIYGEGELLADKISGLQGSISGLGQSGTSKISRVNFLPATDDEAHFTIGWHPFVSESHIIVDISLPSPLLESIIEEITLHPETELNVRIASDVFWFGVLSNHNWHLVGAVLKLITLDMEFEDRSEDQSLDHIMNEMNFRGGPVEVKISMVRSLRSSLEATSDNQSKEHSEKAEISAINGALASLHSEVRNLKRKYEDLQTAYNELSLKRSRRRC